jgi:hypothetical protein
MTSRRLCTDLSTGIGSKQGEKTSFGTSHAQSLGCAFPYAKRSIISANLPQWIRFAD